MAYQFFVSIKGTKQGMFRGESLREQYKDKIPGLRFAYEVKSPRDVASGLASGKHQHSFVAMTKQWGAATPQIFQACVTNELLPSVLFEFMHTTPEGVEEVYHTVKLTNASIAGIRQHIGDVDATAPAGQIDPNELETISFTFQTIEIENRTGKTAASDNWSAGRG